jgi:hypothetical protein
MSLDWIPGDPAPDRPERPSRKCYRPRLVEGHDPLDLPPLRQALRRRGRPAWSEQP